MVVLSVRLPKSQFPGLIMYQVFKLRVMRVLYDQWTTRTKYERQPRKLGSCRLDMNGKSLKTRLKRFHQTPAALFLLYFNVRISLSVYQQ